VRGCWCRYCWAEAGKGRGGGIDTSGGGKLRDSEDFVCTGVDMGGGV
jgi:hypothetical protein